MHITAEFVKYFSASDKKLKSVLDKLHTKIADGG